MPHPRTNLALAGRAVKAEPPAALYDGGASAICLAMSLLKIARMGNPVLRQKAAAVDDPQAPWVRRLVKDMVETMEDAGGTGLAPAGACAVADRRVFCLRRAFERASGRCCTAADG